MRTYKTAIIGLGDIAWAVDEDPQRKGIWSHAKAYDLTAETEIVAVSSRNQQSCRSVQERYQVPAAYADYRQMLEQETLDIVSICTPIHTHTDIVRACIAAGVKAIFCEKTLSFDMADAESIVADCEAAGVLLAVNYVKRWDSVYRHVGGLLADGAIGDLTTIAAFGTTALHSSTSHLIDLMCFYAGEPSWVVGHRPEGFVREVHGIEDPGGVGMVGFVNGVTGFIKGSSLRPETYMSELDIFGTKGRIRIPNDGRDYELYRFMEAADSPGKGYQSLCPIDDPAPPETERMLDAVTNIVRCLGRGGEPTSTGRTSLQALRIIDGLLRSARNGNEKIIL